MARKPIVIATDMPVRDQRVAAAIGVRNTGKENIEPTATHPRRALRRSPSDNPDWPFEDSSLPVARSKEPLVEDYHQQYLAKNPDGYCGLKGTGVSCPIGGKVQVPAH
jgi:hypothetical protein